MTSPRLKSDVAVELVVAGVEKTVTLELTEAIGKDDGHGFKEATPKVTSLDSSLSSSVDTSLGGIRLEKILNALREQNLITDPDKADKRYKAELVSKLVVARTGVAEGERLARRTAWKDGAQKEVHRRLQLRNCAAMERPAVEELQLNNCGPNGVKSKRNIQRRDLFSDSERARFLFYEVFGILHENALLTEDDMLRCRFVCKEWKTSVETFLQDFPAGRQSMWRDGKRASVSLLIRFVGDFNYVVKVLEKANSNYPPDGNPFFSRALVLGMGLGFYFLPPMDLRFWTEVKRLLQKWGSQIWKVQLFLDSRLDPYDQLCSLLTLMPNLKSLELVGGNRYIPWSSTNHGMRHPVPVMDHLTHIFFKMVPERMTKDILQHFGSTLESFVVTGNNGNIREYSGKDSVPNLRQADVIAQSFSGESKFALNSPGLEHVRFELRNVEAVAVPKLFEQLNGMKNNLRRLILHLEKPDGPIAKLTCRAKTMLWLKLPHLEELSLFVSRVNLNTIDFILPMSFLKKLTVQYVKFVSTLEKKKKVKEQTVGGAAAGVALASATDDDSSGEIIKFANFMNRLYESNIWTLMPELKIVNVKVIKKLKQQTHSNEEGESIQERTYTRAGFCQYCIKRNAEEATILG